MSIAPRRGVASPPGAGASGSHHPHGPSRESYTPAQKSSGWPAEASATAPALSAQGLRAAFSSTASAPALLQRELPTGSAEVVAVESPATVPGNGGGTRETQPPKPALPGARQEPQSS